MWRVCHKIELGKFNLDFSSGIEINSSWKTFTDTAVIKVPKNVRTKDYEQVQDVIQRGEPVKVMAGYDDILSERFVGYIAYVKASIPVEFQCEDEMYRHKSISVSPKSWKSCTVNTVLDYMGIQNYDTFGLIELGAFQIDDKLSNQVKVFEKIKEMYGLHFFYRAGKLIVGKPYDSNNAVHHTAVFGKDILPNHSLEFRNKENVKIKVKAISNLKDGSKREVTVGDPEGQEHTLNYYNLDEKSLREIASTELDKLKYTGYRGTFTTFGTPVYHHGDVCEIIDDKYPERSGKFWVDSVKTIISHDAGIKQTIELGFKAG